MKQILSNGEREKWRCDNGEKYERGVSFMEKNIIASVANDKNCLSLELTYTQTQMLNTLPSLRITFFCQWGR